MTKYKKGSSEAKAWGKKMKKARESKSTGGFLQMSRGRLTFRRPHTKKGLGQAKTKSRKFGHKSLKPR